MTMNIEVLIYKNLVLKISGGATAPLAPPLCTAMMTVTVTVKFCVYFNGLYEKTLKYTSERQRKKGMVVVVLWFITEKEIF